MTKLKIILETKQILVSKFVRDPTSIRDEDNSLYISRCEP